MDTSLEVSKVKKEKYAIGLQTWIGGAFKHLIYFKNPINQ
jgi:hypothetical protein